MSKSRNKFLDHGSSEGSDVEAGYDSEAGEVAKGAKALAFGRSAKRRKLSQLDKDSEDSDAAESLEDGKRRPGISQKHEDASVPEDESLEEAQSSEVEQPSKTNTKEAGREPAPTTKSKRRSKTKESKPGVVYLSSLPPYLKPSALRNLLTQRGFEPITRLFLTPASKAKTGSKKNSRQLYTEGWIEFANKKTAKHCAEALNAQIVGGNKRGFYYDDIWNMKYLRGMGWNELMAGIREEKREEEGRRDEERRTIAQETKRFIEGVEEGRRVEGIKRKRSAKADRDGDVGKNGGENVKRTWRQYEVKGKTSNSEKGPRKQDKISDDAKEVLGKIF